MADVAKYFGVNIRTIRNWIASGKVRAYRIGGGRTIRFRRDELDEAMQPVTYTGT